MNPSQFITILRARQGILLAIIAFIVFAAGAISILLPKKYEATSSIVVDLRSPDPINGTLPQTMMSASYLATQVEVLASPRVARRVIDLADLKQTDELKVMWLEETDGQGEYVDWLTSLLLKGLTVKPARDSNIIYITYESKDPKKAQYFSNAFSQAYIDTVLTLRVEPAKEYNRFFDEQSAQVRAKLEASQLRLSDFQRSKGILVTDERLDVENKKLEDLSKQLVDVQGQLADSSSRRSEVKNSSEELQEVTSSPVIAALKADYAAASTRVSELRQRLGDRHPDLQRAQAVEASLKAKLAAETKLLASGVSLSQRVNSQRVKQLQDLVEAQRGRVIAMKGDRDQAAVLQRDLENAQKAYETVLNRVNQSSLESQTQLSNVSVLSAAPLPLRHSSPKILRNIALGLILGTLLSIATALMLEVFDRRIRGASDVIELVGLPVIGALPYRDLGGPQKVTRLANPLRPLISSRKASLSNRKSIETED